MLTTNSIPWSEITSLIKRRHCLTAMQQIDKMITLGNRHWKSYYIHFKKANNLYKDYPPKLVIELAFNIAAREVGSYMTITSDDFSEGEHVSKFLKSLHFDVFEIKKK